jgi:hypothetical protein
VRQDRPHHVLDLSILSGAVLIPEEIAINNTAHAEAQRIAGEYCQAARVATPPAILSRTLGH